MEFVVELSVYSMQSGIEVLNLHLGNTNIEKSAILLVLSLFIIMEEALRFHLNCCLINFVLNCGVLDNLQIVWPWIQSTMCFNFHISSHYFIHIDTLIFIHMLLNIS
jgi:hypothetical protein